MNTLQIVLHHALAALLVGGAVALHLVGKSGESTAAAGGLLTLAGLVIGRMLPQPGKAKSDGFVRLRALLALALICLAACGTWKAAGRATLQAAAQTAYTAAIRADDVCRGTVERCVEDKRKAGVTGPYHCPALERCQAMRRTVTKAAIAMIPIVVAGLGAIDLADAPSLQAAIKMASDTLRPALDALAAFGIKLPGVL